MATTTMTQQDKPKVRRNYHKPVQKIRLGVQIAFSLLCIWIGVEFHFFVSYLESGGTATFVERPPGVDGFLPISSLMSLYYFFLSGQIHPFHPAGLFILSAIILVSLAIGKSFCSWLCPVGFLSEVFGDLGNKLFGRQIRMPRWLDYPLRSVKYLLLAFFVYSIFFLMNTFALEQFLGTPYNLMADVKMYYFFADISRFALIVTGALFLLSIVFRNFWCRYLCPYGALLGITSLFSPSKIKRNPISCIDCGKCAKVCPSMIKVDTVQTVISDECTACMNCVDSCPVADTLHLETMVGKKRWSGRWVAATIVGLFMLVTGGAMLGGQWQNDIPKEKYLHLQENVQYFGHPTSTSDVKKLRKPAPQNGNRP